MDKTCKNCKWQMVGFERAYCQDCHDAHKFEPSEVATLRAKLAAAERERDAERAMNSALRVVLESAHLLFDYGAESCIGGNPRIAESALADAKERTDNINKVLSQTPSDSAERVRGLVEALETMGNVIDDQFGGTGYIPEFGLYIDEKLEPWASVFDAREKAQDALAKWRK